MKSILQDKRLFSFQLLYFILTLLNSFPILLFSYYPSLDGPAHLYNVNLLKEIVLFDNESIKQFFSINPEIIPNWTSHFVLCVLRLVFSSVTADKIFLLVIALSLPVITYSLINRIVPHNKILSVISFPFVYTFLFGLGFYNFCFGVVVFLMTLNYWINRKNRLSIYSIIGLFGLLSLSYFTHILIFILTFSSIGLFSLLHFVNNIYQKSNFRRPMMEILIIILAGLPSLVLSYRYLSIWNPPDFNTRLPLNELLKWIVDARSLIIHNYVAEANFSRLIFFTAITFFLYSIIKLFLSKPVKILPVKLNSPKFFFGILSIILLFLYLWFPNNSSGGSYIYIRLNIIFYLILFLWLFTFKYPKILLKLGFIVILISTAGLSYRNCLSLTNYEKLVKNFKEAEKLVTENSVILPIRNLKWLLDLHFPHYLGWNKPVIILENFEATTRYYPLVWNLEELPTVILGDSTITDICLYNKFPASSKNNAKIDFVIVWGTNDMNECQKNLWMIVNRDYDLIFSAGDPLVSLYKLKSTTSFP